MSKSFWEEALLTEMKAAGIPEPERETTFSTHRRFRFDFCWQREKVAAEVHGGTWSGGRHVTGKGIRSDSEKVNLAQLEGFRVYQFTSDMVSDGTAIRTLKEAFRTSGQKGGKR